MFCIQILFNLFFLLSFLFININFSYGKSLSDEDASSLKLVHVLFRNGDRTVDYDEFYPTDGLDPNLDPYGPGELTKKGKIRVYRLGKALRERYDKFLGKYKPNILEAISSDKNRSKVSLLLVLASWFPPNESDLWEEGINWRPIPYSMVPFKDDKIFFGSNCPNFKLLYKNYFNSTVYKDELEKYKDNFDYILKHSKVDVRNYKNAKLIYNNLKIQKEMGQDIPSWTKKVFPQFLEELTIKSYSAVSNLTEATKLSAGYFLKKIIQDSEAKISGHLKPINRKLFVYSGHDFNIIYLLQVLNLFKPHIPPYGSYILLELHKINDIYGFKIFYQNYNFREPQLLSLPNCHKFCSIENFKSLVEKHLPEEEDC